MTNRITNFSRWLSLLLILTTIIAGSPSGAYAQQRSNDYKTWTTVGSAGTVDEQDTALVTFDGPITSLINNAPDYSSLDIRYNVVPVEGLYDGPPGYNSGCYRLKVRYRDELNAVPSIRNAPEITVLVKLKSMNLSTGAVTTLLTFNSNDFTVAPGFQTQSSYMNFFTFDFSENAYWVEAQLTHGRLSLLSFGQQPLPAAAALAAVQIEYPLGCGIG